MLTIVSETSASNKVFVHCTVKSYIDYLNQVGVQTAPTCGPNVAQVKKKKKGPKREKQPKMLLHAKSVLEDAVTTIGLFIACNSDRPKRDFDNRKKKDWTQLPSLIKIWKDNCGILIEALDFAQRSGPDGQWSVVNLWPHVRPDLENLICSKPIEDDPFKIWSNKYTRTINMANTGIVSTWEWKKNRTDYFRKTPSGSHTTLWAQDFMLYSLFMHELRILYKEQLQSMHPTELVSYDCCWLILRS